MTLADLLGDLKAFDARAKVFLATRPRGTLPAANSAAVVPAGELSFEDTGQDVEIRPAQDGSVLLVGEIANFASKRAHATAYAVFGVTDEVLLPDGRTVRATSPLLGVLEHGGSALLLLGAAEEWPSVQFV